MDPPSVYLLAGNKPTKTEDKLRVPDMSDVEQNLRGLHRPFRERNVHESTGGETCDSRSRLPDDATGRPSTKGANQAP